MAIVSISRIQHRRGYQQDLPQLAAAELGWSMDEQRLFIGNGPLAEGAPRLGNTEILTEHSDILRLAQTYSFKNEDAGYTPTTGGRTVRFNAVAYGNGTYVAVGTNGSIVTSIDAEIWTSVYGGTTVTLNSVCFGNGKFVAVGAGGIIIYSTDGAVWTRASTTPLLTLTSVVYAGGAITNYVAVSSTGSIIYSTDANTWTTVTPTAETLNSVDYYDDLLVAVGTNGTILTSTNASVWTPATSPTTYELKSVNYTNDQWIATGEYSTILVSLDGSAWTYGYPDAFKAGANNGTTWIFVGNGGIIYRVTPPSTELIAVTSNTLENLNDVIYATTGTPRFVAVGANGTILTSTTATVWTAVSSPTSEDLNKVLYDSTAGLFIAVGTNGAIVTSADGLAWTNQTSGVSENLYGIAQKGSSAVYVAVGDNGRVITSLDAVTWSAKASGTIEALESVTVAYLGGTSYNTVIVGSNGTVITTPNIENVTPSFTTQSSGVTEDLHSIKYLTWTYEAVSYTRYLAVGNNGTLISSSDAVTWTTPTIPTTGHMFNIYYSLGQFWVIGGTGYTTIYGSHILSSTTLTSASIATTITTWIGFSGPILYSAAYGSNYYVVAGQFNTLMASADGQNFSSLITEATFNVPSLATSDIFDIIYENNAFLGSGTKGLFITSDDALTFAGYSFVFGNSATTRTLQKKLDDFVSVKDFGAKGDGITDDTEAINRAMFELYCRTSNAGARKVLWFPAGRYMLSDGLNVPTNAILRGEGMNNSVIVQTADPDFVGYVMTTADSLQQTGNFTGLNGAVLPSDILVEDIGMETPFDGVWIQNASRITFNRVRITGETESPTTFGDEWSAVFIVGASLSSPTDITFTDCYFEKFNYGVYQVDTEFSRNLVFNSTTFFNLYKGLKLCEGGGRVNTMTISNCVFDYINAQAIDANYVTNVVSTFNSYRDVGNNFLGVGNATSSILKFGNQSIGCASISDQFDRTEQENYDVYPWVEGNSTTSAWFNGHEIVVGLWEQAGGEEYTLVPGSSNTDTGFEMTIADNFFNRRVQYLIVRGNYTRTGILNIVYNDSSLAYAIDDDSTETGDVGTIFNLSSDGTTLSLQYTATSGGSNFNLYLAESYLKTAWF